MKQFQTTDKSSTKDKSVSRNCLSKSILFSFYCDPPPSPSESLLVAGNVSDILEMGTANTNYVSSLSNWQSYFFFFESQDSVLICKSVLYAGCLSL